METGHPEDPRPLARRLIARLFADVPGFRASPPPRRAVVARRVGDLLARRGAPLPPLPEPPAVDPDPVGIMKRPRVSRPLLALAVAAALLAAWAFGSDDALAVRALPRSGTVLALVRCAGARELALAWREAQSIGLARGTIAVRAPALWDSPGAPVEIRIGESAKEAAPALVLAGAPLAGPPLDLDAPAPAGPEFSIRFPAATVAPPAVRAELSVMGEPLARLTARPADAAGPVALLRDRARDAGLALSVQKLSSGQVLPLPDGPGGSLWEYGVRVAGHGAVAGLERYLGELDRAGWTLHVTALDVTFAGDQARFTLAGALYAGGPAGASAPVVVGQRRLLAGDREPVCEPAGAVALARLAPGVFVVTPREPGPVTLAWPGARPLALAVQPGSEPPAPIRAGAPARSSGAAPPLDPRAPVPPFPQLLGTVAAERGARALFADKDARTGDRIGVFTLDEILESGVRLSWNGRRFFLPLTGTAREEVDLTP